MPAVETGQFSRLVELAQSAGLDQRKWGWFLKELSHASGGARVQIFSHDIKNDQPLGFHEFGHDPEYLQTYRDHFGSINPWIAGFARLIPGVAVYGRQIIRDEDLRRTEFYNDWVRPQEDIIGSATAILKVSGNRVTAIAANIPDADRDRVEPRIRNLIQRLAPHLRNSLEISDALGQLTLENRVLRAGVEPDIAALFVLNVHGHVCYSNARGERLAERGDIVRIDPRAQLAMTDPRANAKLARALHDRSLFGLNVSLPFVAGGASDAKFVCQTTPLSDSDGPHPWIGPANDAGRAYTLLILSPTAPHMNHARCQSSLH